MTGNDRYDKARALFLALVMVVSVFGMTAAFAGSAVADTTELELSDGLVQDGETVYANGSVGANGTVYAFIDENDDGQYNAENDTITGSDTVDNYEEDPNYSIELDTSGLESGTYDVQVLQNDTLDEDATGERNAELQVDADAPEFGDVSPEAGSTISTSQDIVVPISDANTSVDHITATVTENDGDEVTLEINPGTASDDGVEFADGELTITPGEGNVPALDEVDSTYSVKVNAEDEVGNSAEKTFEFTIQSADPLVALDEPDTSDENVTLASPKLSGEDPVLLTNYENETVKISFTSQTDTDINDSTVTLDLYDENDQDAYHETFDYEDDEYTNGSNEFSVTPDGDAIPSFEDDTYAIELYVEDEAGNSNRTAYFFDVDLTSPEVTDISLTDDEINISDTEDTEGVNATVEFDEQVDKETVDVTVNLDSDTTGATDTVEYGDDKSEVVVPLNVDDGSYDKIENDSSVLNVTAAQDLAGNELANADADASNATFAIDTSGPTVTVVGSPGEVENVSEPIQGYVNFTTFVMDTTDVSETSYSLEVGQASNATIQFSDLPFSAENVPTQDLPDGKHNFGVTVEDSAGNTDTGTVAVEFDNGQPVDVTQQYLPGLVTPYDQGTTPVAVNEIFTDEENVVTSYWVGDNKVESDDTINPENYRGQVVPVKATLDNGETISIDLEFAPLVGAESVSSDEIKIGVDTSGLEIDSFDVTVEDTDGHFAQTERTISDDKFTEYGEDSGIYSKTIDGLDDGTYKVTVTDADGDDVTDAVFAGENSLDETATVDAEDPKAETAYVIGSNGDTTAIRVEFNEVVNHVNEEDVTFDGSSEVVQHVENGDADGVLIVILDGEVQTADAPLLNVSDVTEANGDDSTTEVASTQVATVSLDLTSDGLNVVSIPAEAGRVPIEDTGLNSDAINTVLAYDAEEDDWHDSYSPSAKENNLTHLVGGQGYVVNAEEDTTVEINAQNVPANERQAFQSQDIYEGWNLIGHYQEGPQSVGQALTYLDTTYDIELGYTSMQVDELQAGQGYWLFSNGEGVHAPVNYDGAASDRPAVGNVQVVDDDGVLKNGEEVKITAEVQHDTVIDSVVAKPDTRIANEDVRLTDENDNGRYTGTVTIEFSEDAEPDERYNVRVEAFDVDGNLGIASGESPPTDSELATAQTVTNVDTGVTYNTLTGALSEVKEFETLELSEGTFAEDRDSLTISTDNIALKGQGESLTEIAADVELAGSDIHVEGIDYVANSPTGDVTVTGEGTTLESVGSEGTISIDADSVTVSNSNAETISVNANATALSNTKAKKGISIADSVNSDTVTFSGESSLPDGAVAIDGESGTYDTIQAAIDDAETNDVIRVGSGTFTQSSTIGIDTKGVTLESANGPSETTIDDDGTLNDSSENSPIELSLIEASASNTTVRGLTVDPSVPTQIGIRLTADDSRAINNVVDDPPSDSDRDPGSGGISTSGDVGDIVIKNNTINNAPIAHTADGTVEITDNTVTGDLVAEKFFSYKNPNTVITMTGNDFTGASTGDGYADLKFVRSGTSVNGVTAAPEIADTTISENDGVDVVKVAGDTFSDAETLYVEKGDGDINEDINAVINTADNIAGVNTVQLAAGTYDQSVTVDVNGLTLEGIDEPTITNGVLIDGANDVTLSGLEVEGSELAGDDRAIGLINDVDGLTVEDSTILTEDVDQGDGILNDAGSDFTNAVIKNNTFKAPADGGSSNNARRHIYVNNPDSSSSVDIINNTFTGDGLAGGLAVGTAADDSEISGNTFDVSSNYGQLEVYASGGTIEDNTFNSGPSGSFYFSDASGYYDEGDIKSDNTFPGSAEIGDNKIVES